MSEDATASLSIIALMRNYPFLSDYLIQVDHTGTQTFDPLEGQDNPNPPSGAAQRPSLSFQYANLGDVNDADLVERVLEIWHAHRSMPEEAADVRLRAVIRTGCWPPRPSNCPARRTWAAGAALAQNPSRRSSGPGFTRKACSNPMHRGTLRLIKPPRPNR